MKKLIISALIILTATAQAQTTGEAAVATAKVAKENNWQNWVFAGCALLTAAGAIFVVSMHNGNSASTN